jgi:hypothetical protein
VVFNDDSSQDALILRAHQEPGTLVTLNLRCLRDGEYHQTMQVLGTPGDICVLRRLIVLMLSHIDASKINAS